MDVTYTDTSWQDAGILDVVELDMAYGSDENDFVLTVANADFVEPGCLVYLDDGAGGIVRGFDDTSTETTVKITGDTWQGILADKVIRPDVGSAYLTVSGDANAVLARLVARLDLTDLFRAHPTTSGIPISYTFRGYRDTADSGRYEDAYTGISDMLWASGAKLVAAWDHGTRKVVLRALPVTDRTDGAELTSDVFKVRITATQPVNHLVCLGKGEMADRTVVDLYADANGNVSTTRTFGGVDEIAAVYDAGNDEASELVSDGTKKLRELREGSGAVEVAVTPSDDIFDIGDIARGTDEVVGLMVEARIVKKVVKMKDGRTSVSYETGAAKVL